MKLSTSAKKNITTDFILLSLLVSGAILVTGCGLSKVPGAKPGVSSLALSANGMNGKQAFQASLLKAMQSTSKCSDCHTSNGAQAGRPFADSNVDIAYSAALAGNLVTFTNVAGSTVLTQLTNGHCGGPECSVTDQSIITKFKQAAQTWATAELASKSSSGSSTSSTPSSANPNILPVSGLTGELLSGGANIVDPVPMSPNTPAKLMIPLSAINAKFGTSYVRFDISYLTSEVTNGVTVYLYILANPVLVNKTAANTITVSGIDIIQNGYYDNQNRIFADPTIFTATATAGQTVSLDPQDTKRAMSFWGSPSGNFMQVDLKTATVQ